LPRKRLILITGMSGSGKTTVAEMFQKEGYSIITMGDVIRELATERGLEQTPQVLGSLAKEMREEHGDGAVAVECVKKLQKTDEDLVVVDGIRSLAEVDVFKESFDAVLVATHASPETRFKRLNERGRSDDPNDLRVFRERDMRQLGFHMGWAIGLADHMIVNEGSIEDLRNVFRDLMEKLGRK
jgi:dephospho-CoA kinase